MAYLAFSGVYNLSLKSIYGNKQNLNENMSMFWKICNTHNKEGENCDTVLEEEITDSLAQIGEEHPILHD